MAIPVNLYVDRMSPVQPVRVADVYAVTADRASSYKEAAAKIGLTTQEYSAFRQALNDGGAIYVRLPRRIDAMAGIHRRNGRVYALRNVIVPDGTMGWQVRLADGATIYVPRICGNLSMNRSRVLAHRPRTIAQRTQPKAVRAARYLPPQAAVIPPTPVTFDVPQVAAAGGPAPVFAAGIHHSSFPFLGLLLPLIGSLHGGTNVPQPVTAKPTTPDIPPCSAGSTTLGVCRQ